MNGEYWGSEWANRIGTALRWKNTEGKGEDRGVKKSKVNVKAEERSWGNE